MTNVIGLKYISSNELKLDRPYAVAGALHPVKMRLKYEIIWSNPINGYGEHDRNIYLNECIIVFLQDFKKYIFSISNSTLNSTKYFETDCIIERKMMMERIFVYTRSYSISMEEARLEAKISQIVDFIKYNTYDTPTFSFPYVIKTEEDNFILKSAILSLEDLRYTIHVKHNRFNKNKIKVKVERLL